MVHEAVEHRPPKEIIAELKALEEEIARGWMSWRRCFELADSSAGDIAEFASGYSKERHPGLGEVPFRWLRLVSWERPYR